MVKSLTMVMSNKILSGRTQFAQISSMNGKKKQSKDHITDFKQTQRQIHNTIKHQNFKLQKAICKNNQQL